MKTTKLEKTGACSPAICYVRTQKSYVDAWNNCPRGDWMLWIAAKLQIDKRLLTLAKGKCASTVLHLMKDKRSKKAVQAAIDYGHGLIGDEELKNAADDAYTAADAAADYDADDDDAYAAYAVAAAAYAAANAATYAAAAYAAYAVAAAVKKQNQLKTANICREVLTEAVFNKWNNLK